MWGTGVACELTVRGKIPRWRRPRPVRGTDLLRAVCEPETAPLDEEVKYEYMVHEAWRRFYNL